MVIDDLLTVCSSFQIFCLQSQMCVDMYTLSCPVEGPDNCDPTREVTLCYYSKIRL